MLGMKPGKDLAEGFNMGILALKIAGKKWSKQTTWSSFKRIIWRSMA